MGVNTLAAGNVGVVLFAAITIAAEPVQLEVLTFFEDATGSSPRGGLVEAPDGSFYGTSYGGRSGIGTVFRVTTDGDLNTIASFTGANGAWPNGLSPGPDGRWYGTCSGGVNGNFFQVTTNGISAHWFPFDGFNGSHPEGRLALGPDGNFYGVTASGGRYDWGVGTAFKITTNGVVTSLVSFSYAGGYHPAAGLTLGSDGNFYGTAYEGGYKRCGTVFRLTTNGVLTHLVAFNQANGANPVTALTQASDGFLYGTAYRGGTDNLGTIFRVSTNGALTKLVSFNGSNGAHPLARLIVASDGLFYGTTSSGGTFDQGTLFSMTTNGVLTTLISFSGVDGAIPLGDLTLGSDGNLYGTTSEGGRGGRGTVFQWSTNGVLTTLASFHGGKGRTPNAELVWLGDGTAYGTTTSGGWADKGTVFRITTNGTHQALFSFLGTNGANPTAGLAAGPDGLLYGTTAGGGNSDLGTVYKITTNGVLTTLVSFDGTNGANPVARVTLANDGGLYGTTIGGGDYDRGTVFKITSNAAFGIVVSFDGTNGAEPRAALTAGSDGSLYGTTYLGGTNGLGTIFKVTANGALTSLVSFAGTNGANPRGGLSAGKDGYFYGTTFMGGTYGSRDDGTVYRVTTNGVLRRLVSFSRIGPRPSGDSPIGELILGQDGAFYGIASGYKSGGDGTAFKVTTTGVLTTLKRFSNAYPYSGLVPGPDGNLYGTTRHGGTEWMGTVYRLGIPPEIATQLSSVSVTNGDSVNLRADVAGTPFNIQWYVSEGRDATGLANVGTSGQPFQVTSVTITDPGAGYQSAPQVDFIGVGIPATGTAAVSNGMVTAISVEFPGFYFYAPPVVEIAGPTAPAYPITGRTNAYLSFESVSNADETNYFFIASNNYGSVTSGIVRLAVIRVNHPPTADASATSSLIVSGDSVEAAAALDGSRSSDPDDDPLTYHWYLTTSPIATGIVVLAVLPVGSHTIALVVDDGLAQDTNAVTVTVLTTAEAVQRLVGLVNESDLRQKQPLLASLQAALKSIDHNNCHSAVGQLHAFQNKVQAQVSPSDSILAIELVQSAGQVIEALGCDKAERIATKLHGVKRGQGGKMKLKFHGTAGQAYIVEVSTNLVDWEPVGVATLSDDGSFKYEDVNAATEPCRFYRIKQLPH